MAKRVLCASANPIPLAKCCSSCHHGHAEPAPMTISRFLRTLLYAIANLFECELNAIFTLVVSSSAFCGNSSQEWGRIFRKLICSGVCDPAGFVAGSSGPPAKELNARSIARRNLPRAPRHETRWKTMLTLFRTIFCRVWRSRFFEVPVLRSFGRAYGGVTVIGVAEVER